MTRHFWIGLAVIGAMEWAALDGAHYLGRIQGHQEAIATIKAFDAGLAAGGSAFRLCSERTASGVAPRSAKTGSTR